jgi:uncharacterized protein (TIGR03435 family)
MKPAILVRMVRQIAAMLLGATALFAGGPAFEVAAIRPSPPTDPGRMVHFGMKVDGARVDMSFMPMEELVRIAWGVKPFQVTGPDWLKTTRFDIQAALPAGATREQIPEMLRTLLESRFGLQAHSERRDLPIYSLTEAKGGAKLKAAEDTSLPAGVMKMGMSPEGGVQIQAPAMQMPAFAELLTRFVDRPVFDETGLKGTYELKLEISREDANSAMRNAGVTGPAMHGTEGDSGDPSGGSIFSALGRLGLKLEAKKSSVDVVVVDRVEKSPTDN